MRIVSKRRIVEFYATHASSKTALEEWCQKVTRAEWTSLNKLKLDYSTADYVRNDRVVFNIKGNDYRLVAIVIYISQKVYIRWIGTHAEYDRVDVKNI